MRLFTLLFIILVSSCVALSLFPLLQKALLTVFMPLYALICATLWGFNRPSCWSLLPFGCSLPQRDAPPRRPVRQNQRCVGDPTGITATHQASGERAVWGGLDGYGSSRLQRKRQHWRDHTEPAGTPDRLQNKSVIRPKRGGNKLEIGTGNLNNSQFGSFAREVLEFSEPFLQKSSGKTSSVVRRLCSQSKGGSLPCPSLHVPLPGS